MTDDSDLSKTFVKIADPSTSTLVEIASSLAKSATDLGIAAHQAISEFADRDGDGEHSLNDLTAGKDQAVATLGEAFKTFGEYHMYPLEALATTAAQAVVSFGEYLDKNGDGEADIKAALKDANVYNKDSKRVIDSLDIEEDTGQVTFNFSEGALNRLQASRFETLSRLGTGCYHTKIGIECVAPLKKGLNFLRENQPDTWGQKPEATVDSDPVTDNKDLKVETVDL